MHDYTTTVKTIRVWWGHGVDHDGFKAIQVVFFNGEQKQAGVLPSSGADASFTFNAGEFITGEITICGNGVGTRTGYLHFRTNLGNEFKAGNQHTPYYFEAEGTLLAGFFGQSGSDIDQLGLYLFKSVKSIHITGIDYPTLDSYLAGLSPSSIVDRPYCNNSPIDQHEDREVTIASGSKESWSLSATESFEMTVGVEVSAGVPEIDVSGKETDTFKWGISSTQSYSMEQDTTTTVEEELHFYYPANTKGEIRYTQFDSTINVPWQGYEHVTFKDGTTMTLAVGGTYNGVYVSRITPVFDSQPCNPCNCNSLQDAVTFEDKEDEEGVPLEDIQGSLPAPPNSNVE